MTTGEDIIIWRDGSLGRIRLNRPKALNSLTIGMILSIGAALADFAEDPAVAAVLADGAGERGFCAGGDIRALHDGGKANDGSGELFFKEEYALDAAIAAYKKPYIAFMDGITMGGGVGISAHGAHRIVTERTKLAMPETGIGFFPDVGGTWLLGHGPGEIGTYIGLTGATFGGPDAIYAGFADILVPSTELPALATKLSTLPPGATQADVRALLTDIATPIDPPLAAHRTLIDHAMSFDTIPEILAALTEDGSEFAKTTLTTLAAKSPTSLALTLRLLRLGRASQTLTECLDREYFAACKVLKGHDFYEGVRAAVIDKDRTPHWRPTSIEAITPADIDAYLPN
jgi:enoyl-CoA hydratase